ncbi:MAG: IPT/TIG domain-containing protein [Candidatus Obscuribacterales bacterium]|nr:IPT/TIG domain-containing protein [Candidatus Obscuribacterales bacterium]
MGKKFLAILFSLICSFTTPGVSADAQDLKKLPRVVISSGGPYTANGGASIQSFDDAIELPREYSNKPLALVLTNGSVNSSGFSWVRMFLQNGGSDTNLQAGAQELGRMLCDENSFLNNAQMYVDMTSQLAPGRNRIHIEGVGRQGAQFYWELRSIGAPQLSKLNPRVTMAGAQLVLAGMGFSVRPSENIVMLGPAQLQVIESNGHMLQVYVPPNMPEGQFPLYVGIQSMRSNVLQMEVLPSPKVSSVNPIRLLPGQTISIRGSGFSTTPQENRVYIGRYPAPVVSSNSQLINAIVPNMPAGNAKITVVAGGATAQGNPEISISYLNR